MRLAPPKALLNLANVLIGVEGSLGAMASMVAEGASRNDVVPGIRAAGGAGQEVLSGAVQTKRLFG